MHLSMICRNLHQSNRKINTMKLKQIIFSLSVASLAFLASCSEEASTPKPTISLNSGAGYVSKDGDVNAASPVTFSITATAGTDALKNIVITCVLANGSTKSLLDTTLSGKTVSFTKTMLAQGGVGDAITYTFTANDANGQSASTKVTTNVIPFETALDGVAGQKVYNATAAGMNKAYNLFTSTGLTSGAAGVQDILDKTTTGSTQWSKIWGSGNGSKFVKITDNDYNNAEGTGYIYSLWKSYKATATDQVTLTEGDCYLVKSGQDIPFGLYVLKVTAVVDLPAVGNNNDYAQFDYKGIIAQ